MVLYVKSMALPEKWDKENEEKEGIGKTLDFYLSKRIHDDLKNSGWNLPYSPAELFWKMTTTHCAYTTAPATATPIWRSPPSMNSGQ